MRFNPRTLLRAQLDRMCDIRDRIQEIANDPTHASRAQAQEQLAKMNQSIKDKIGKFERVVGEPYRK